MTRLAVLCFILELLAHAVACFGMSDLDLVRETIRMDDAALVRATLEDAEADDLVAALQAVKSAARDVREELTREVPLPVEMPKSAEPPKQTTTVCQCKGTDRGVCLCLKAGAACKCTATVGSVWQKTDAKVDLKTGAPAQGSAKPTMEPVKPAQVAQPSSRWESRTVCGRDFWGRKTCSTQMVWVTK